MIRVLVLVPLLSTATATGTAILWVTVVMILMKSALDLLNSSQVYKRLVATSPAPGPPSFLRDALKSLGGPGAGNKVSKYKLVKISNHCKQCVYMHACLKLKLFEFYFCSNLVYNWEQPVILLLV